MLVYPAVIHKQTNSYNVTFPDFPGCHTGIEQTIEAAVEHGYDALIGHITTMIKYGDEIPTPGSPVFIRDILSTDDVNNNDVVYAVVHFTIGLSRIKTDILE